MSNPMDLPGKFPNAILPVAREDEHFIERHTTFLRQIKENPIDILFLGDSITRRWSEVPHLWTNYFGSFHPANFGVGGDRVENLRWRIENGEIEGIQPKVVVLLIGTNNVFDNTSEEISDSIHQIVATLLARLPETRIILNAIFPRGPQVRENPDCGTPWCMDVINATNKLLAYPANHEAMYFLDMGTSLLKPDGEIDANLMPDKTHLIEPGYRIWGDALSGILKEVIDLIK